MDLYINSVGLITGAGNNVGDNKLNTSPDYNTTHLLSVEPDYKPFIPVMQLRRMSKAVRMGVVASKVAMSKAGVDAPDAIVVGSAYGCMQDTERFLDKLVSQDEQMLTPTAFIQSTHNTVSGQIALLAKCNGHNLTYVHRGHSFEHALINTKLYLDDHKDEHVLVGGIDELTPNSVKALQQAGMVAKEDISAESMQLQNEPGAVGGEGAAFFSVTQKPISDRYIKVKSLEIFTAKDQVSALAKTQKFLDGSSLDAVMLGVSSRDKYASYYNGIKEKVSDTAQLSFKNLCGEYPVASSFALGILLEGVANGAPDSIVLNKKPTQLKTVALVNNFGKYYSNWLLELSV